MALVKVRLLYAMFDYLFWIIITDALKWCFEKENKTFFLLQMKKHPYSF